MNEWRYTYIHLYDVMKRRDNVTDGKQDMPIIIPVIFYLANYCVGAYTYLFIYSAFSDYMSDAVHKNINVLN